MQTCQKDEYNFFRLPKRVFIKQTNRAADREPDRLYTRGNAPHFPSSSARSALKSERMAARSAWAFASLLSRLPLDTRVQGGSGVI